MPKVRRIVLLSVVVLALPGQGSAQAVGASPVASDTARTRAIDQLPAAAHIRVSTPASSRLSGRLREARHDTLVLVDGSRERRVPVVAIDSLWKSSRAAKQGAVIGAISGAVVLGALGYVIAEAFCDVDNCEATRGIAAKSTAVGALGGGVLGLAIGSLVVRWELRYHRYS
jgi:hypothetical protein